MKLVFLTPTLSHPGGMERVLHNKVCWLVHKGDYDITIITTDQQDRPNFFSFPKSVEIIDLGINYSSVYTKSPIIRILSTLLKKRIHFKSLSQLLKKIRPDITITLYPSNTVTIPRIKDGSKKIIEFHSNRFFRLNQGYKGIHQLIAKFRIRQDYRFVKKFDKLVVLTDEGAAQWGGIPNIEVIPNAIITPPRIIMSSESKRVIAVGRLIHEKGFDRLIQAWSLLPKDLLEEWQLDIYGQGEQELYLKELIYSLNLGTSAKINKPTKNIFEEYKKSAFLVMTSYSEGFGMVLVEAMSCGLPAICFDFSCGPKDLIDDNINGFLVENGNILLLSKKMERLMRDNNLRFTFSKNAKQVKDKFSEENVMCMWEQLFNTIIKK